MNASTLIIALILLLIVSSIVFYLIKNKRQGKTNCGSKCAGCALKDTCHKADNRDDSLT